MYYRGVTVVAGIVILAAAAHVTVEHMGGYSEPEALWGLAPHAVLTWAVAGGLAVGSVAIGAAWAHGRKGVAGAIAVALICGELFALSRMAERLVEHRAEKTAPFKAALEKRKSAEAAVAAAVAALRAMPAISPRLKAALDAQSKARAAQGAALAERYCAKQCRIGHQGTIAATTAEVAAARKALGDGRRGAQHNVKAAKVALAAIPPSRPPGALARALGASPLFVDLLIAIFGSIGVNGLGAALLAYGGHAPVVRKAGALEIEARIVEPTLPAFERRLSFAPIEDEHDHVKKFAMSRLIPDESAALTFERMVEVYQGWCRAEHVETLPLDRAAELFAELVNHLELKVEHRDGDPVIIGLAVEKQDLKLIEAA